MRRGEIAEVGCTLVVLALAIIGAIAVLEAFFPSP